MASKSLILNVCVFLTVANLPANSVEQAQVPHLTFQVPWFPTEIQGRTWCKSPDARGTEKPFGFTKLGLHPNHRNKSQLDLFGCITNNTGQPLNVQYIRVRHTFANGETRDVDRYLYPQDIPLVALPAPFSSGQPAFFFIPLGVTASAVDLVIEIETPKGQGHLERYPLQRLTIIRR